MSAALVTVADVRIRLSTLCVVASLSWVGAARLRPSWRDFSESSRVVTMA
jgi:hypothetical protein